MALLNEIKHLVFETVRWRPLLNHLITTAFIPKTNEHAHIDKSINLINYYISTNCLLLFCTYSAYFLGVCRIMSRDEVSCIELVFTRGPSTSRRAKAKDLWTFLDNQSDIKPFVPSPIAPETVQSNNSSNSTSEKSVSLETLTQNPRDYPWYEGLCILRYLGLDKVALAAKDACSDYKQPLNERNVTQENGILADAVEEMYDDINFELEAFEERVKSNDGIEPKRRVYGVPEKYE